MTFHKARERIGALGFGLVYQPSSDRWQVLHRKHVVHEAADLDDALGFCQAWAEHVR